MNARSLVTTIAVASSIVALVAHADEPMPGVPGVEKPLAHPDVAPASADPSPWACDLQTLVDGKRCHFDALAPQSNQKKKNEATIAGLPKQLCDRIAAARTDASPLPADERALCETEIGEAAKACKVDAPLVDDDGRFAAGQPACFRTLRRAVDDVRQASDTWSSCCRCLAAKKCTTATLPQCALGMAKNAHPAVTRSCLESSCAAECRAASPILFPPAVVPAPSSTPAAPQTKSNATPTSMDL